VAAGEHLQGVAGEITAGRQLAGEINFPSACRGDWRGVGLQGVGVEVAVAARGARGREPERLPPPPGTGTGMMRFLAGSLGFLMAFCMLG
jgi:hypothetical protein